MDPRLLIPALPPVGRIPAPTPFRVSLSVREPSQCEEQGKSHMDPRLPV